MATTSWLEEIRRQLGEVTRALWSEVEEHGVVRLVQPVGPYGEGMLGPFTAVGGLLAVLLLSGIAVAAMGTTVLALLALWMVLARVFGFSIDVSPFAAR